MKKHFNAISNSYSDIFFLRGYQTGLLLLATTAINPNVAASGLIAVFAAYLFAKFINMDRAFINSGFYTYNPLLVGLSIGYLFKITPLTVFFNVVAGISTFVVTAMLYHIFSYYLLLPILSLPFVLVSSSAYLASSKYSNLFVTGLYPHFTPNLEIYFPLWVSGFFKSLGAIFFLPQVLPGLIISLIILFSSRVLFMLAVAGYYTGTLITGLLAGSFPQAFADINHFNFILISMAMGGVFLVPSVKSYLLAMIAVSASTMLLASVKVFWSYFAIPAFTLPFNLVTLSFMYVLGLVNYPLLAKYIKPTPEETLDHYLSNLRRYKGSDRTFVLPFSGKWTVWQAFDGNWTHQGSWKYAYDFIIEDEHGKSHKNEGRELSDYYAFKKPILSPVRGRVLTVINAMPDNDIGQTDKANSWGNLLILQDHRGFFVKISHLAQGSITAQEGDWVERGTFLGLCGNSGYSPQPHIHIQAQITGEVGSHTVPFSFLSYEERGKFYANDLPATKAVVEPLCLDKGMDMKTSFLLDHQVMYQVEKDGEKTDEVTLTVRMAMDGTFYFDSGKGKLYFGKHEGTFYFYHLEGDDPYLKLLFMALPKLPLVGRENLEWTDQLPVGVVCSGMKKAMVLFLTSFYHDFAEVSSTMACKRKGIIEGVLYSRFLNIKKQTYVELDEYVGIKTIKVDGVALSAESLE